MKVIKGNKTYPVITGDDVIVTKGSQSLRTVDDALDNQQKEIDKLKSNVKYIYSYGGVGGNGSGGNGGSTSSGEASLLITLDGHKITGDNNAIVLGKPGKYNLSISLRNSGGKEYYIQTSVGGKAFSKRKAISVVMGGMISTEEDLQTNGSIIVKFYNPEGDLLDSIEQAYIVNPHTFDMKLKCNGNSLFTGNEYFIGNTDYTGLYAELTYSINIPNVNNVIVSYSIGDTDKKDEQSISGQFSKDYGMVTNNINEPLRISFDNLTKNGTPLLQDANMGNYKLHADIYYSVNGEPVTSEKNFSITFIPNHLYINVRNDKDLLYNSLEELLDACDSSKGGIPKNSISEGAYAMFFCKVYEGEIGAFPHSYMLSCSVFDESGESESEYVFNDVPSNKGDDGKLPSMTVSEQEESQYPFSIPFTTPGIKKLVFKVTNAPKYGSSEGFETVKYIYVRESSSDLTWYPETSGEVDFQNTSYYFRANNGNNTYSENFPQKLGTQPFETRIADRKSVVLTDQHWKKLPNDADTTIVSFGIQYSMINSDSEKILEIFLPDGDNNYKTPAVITLYPDHIFNNAGEIRIINEANYDKTKLNKYHLVQIVRTKISKESNVYATYLYIDGIIESVSSSTDINRLYVGKIELNNVNVSYNLINVQYVKKGDYTVDELIYQYSLKYKEVTGKEITESETDLLKVLKNHTITFDGTSVRISDNTQDNSVINTIVKKMPIPTLMVEYNTAVEGQTMSQEDIAEFERVLFQGYENGDTDSGFKHRPINVFWCDAWDGNNAPELQRIEIPTIAGLTGTWNLELQGTSTMRNRIKNFSLIIDTQDGDNTGNRLLMSPNYDPDDPHTFLPEQIWTIKADIADSAHANNTSVGKFVNRTCTLFKTAGLDPNDKYDSSKNTDKFIKNTLEGFPVLMFFRIGPEVHYLGVYNFNMGRNSYYNLGYYTPNETERMRNRIVQGTAPFYFSYGSGELQPGLTVAEVQDNFTEFDFHQYDTSVLFAPDEGANRITRMFGGKNKVTTGNTWEQSKNTIQKFVQSVALAGAYCFGNIGKEPESIRSESNKAFIDIYGLNKNHVPDVSVQFRYNSSEDKEWSDDENNPWSPNPLISLDSAKGDVKNLLQCISDVDLDGQEIEINGTPTGGQYLDFTSASEYYTICMAFGLIDSVMKNMNIKTWNNHKFYIAFYDMDCALGEDNGGNENVSYLAATDYWHSEKNSSGILEDCDRDWDYWDDNAAGKGFDCKSSYLYAIVKYAQALLKGQYNLTNYPQDFWVTLRNTELSSADNFVNKYFKSGIGTVPAYMASLDYQVKYLYYGSVINKQGQIVNNIYLANSSQFHGSRVEKVRDWLNKRLHFLDVMFNVQNISIQIYGEVTIPAARSENLSQLRKNPDVVILSDAFSLEGNNALNGLNNFRVDLYAPKHTPLIIERGSSPDIYILSEETGSPNTVLLSYTQSLVVRFYGSKALTNISRIEGMLTNAYVITSDSLEKINYGRSSTTPQTNTLTITSISVKEINLQISNWTAELSIATPTTDNELLGQAIDTINIAGSGFYGNWNGLKNLQNLNISSVHTDQNIVIKNSPLLRGENCIISGTEDNLTRVGMLDLSDVSGKFTFNNTAIREITINSNKGEVSEFEIEGDERLETLNLSGFSKVHISKCPNLRKLSIEDSNDYDENKCREIIIDIPSNPDNIVLRSLNSDDEDLDGYGGGVFDFSGYSKLETLGLTGCLSARIIRIPDRKVKVISFMNNENLEFVDTAGKDSVISLTGDNTFYNCPRYGMRQSWSKDMTSATPDPMLTRMCIDESCTSLAHTFDKVTSTIVSVYTSSHPYVNSLNQNIVNKPITLTEAKEFLNTFVAGGILDDAYVESNTVTDPQGIGRGTKFGNNRCGSIISLQGCFRFQKDISYTSSGSYRCPDLSAYTSLIDVAGLYYGTGVKYLDSKLLSLPDSMNNNSAHTLNWAEFIGRGELNVDKKALEHISYRITDINSVTYTVYEVFNDYGISCSRVDIIDILCPKEYEGTDGIEGVDYIILDKDNTHTKYIPIKRLTSFNTFNINSNQTVDYRGMFELCPNVTTLTGFLNCDLSCASIDGMLKKCRHLVNVTDSFSHTGNMDNAPTVDLYDFFNWDDPESGCDIYNMHSLFGSSNVLRPGFTVNKTISYENFKKIMKSLKKYKSLTKLSNLFSYCIIDGYDMNDEIELLSDDENEFVVMKDILSIDSLFYKCKSSNDTPLNIRRSFFAHLPNVQSMNNTFGGVHFAHMLTYDFFCKRSERVDETNNIYVDENGTRGTLKKYKYGESPISSMYCCFKDAKFVNCKCWFDHNDDYNLPLVPEKDEVMDGSGREYEVYYTLEGGKYISHPLADPTEVSDTRNNFTNYVESINIAATGFIINNHDIYGDLRSFGNGNEIFDKNSYDIYPTYCCLPPDIFYNCYKDCNLTGVFANTNIIGVLPQHLLKYCYRGSFGDMFLNVNILPNVVYHYNSSFNDEQYLAMLNDIDIDNDSINQNTESPYDLDMNKHETVLFRDGSGVLKRRHPRTTGEYSKSQFAYVPQGYTTNTNLDRAFTFRYNLPKNVDLFESELLNKDIDWHSGNYTDENRYSPENAPGMWPYYIQYFFLADESVEWRNIDSMIYPFISDNCDIDFSNSIPGYNPVRLFSSDNNSSSGIVNVWCDDRSQLVNKEWWNSKTNGVFNSFLDLCGERDRRTGVFTDSGCFISRSIANNRYPKLNSFVSGILGIFLNGKVFDSSVDAGLLSSGNINSEESGKIVIFNGFGRNIKLPEIRTLMDSRLDPKIVLDYNPDTSQFYEFMFTDSEVRENYSSRYFQNTVNNVLITNDGNNNYIFKYIVKP